MAITPGVPAPSPRRAPAGVMRRREAYAGLLFVSPWIIFLLVFTAYPVLAALYFSFTNYNIIQPPQWAGLQNYTVMFTADPDFLTGIGNSAYYAIISVVLGLLGSLLLALVMNIPARGIGVYRTLLYLPGLVPPVAGTVVFMLMLDPSNGLINVALSSIGLPTPGWLADPAWSKPALIVLSLWGIGTSALIFLAGLQEIPQSLIDAAMIDGAGPWQRFRSVTLPLLSPVILFNLVMGIIYSFQVFAQSLIVGGSTGEPVGSTLMFMVLIYNNAFKYFQMGYASALAMILFVAVLALTLGILRSSRAWVYYEATTRGE